MVIHILVPQISRKSPMGLQPFEVEIFFQTKSSYIQFRLIGSHSKLLKRHLKTVRDVSNDFPKDYQFYLLLGRRRTQKIKWS